MGVGLGVGATEDVGLAVGVAEGVGLTVGVLGCVVPGVVAGVVPGVVVPGFTGVGFVDGFVVPGFDVPGFVVPGFVVAGLVPGFELGEMLPAGWRLGLSFAALSLAALSFAFASAEAKPGMVKYVDEELTSPGAWMNVPTDGFKALIIFPLPM